MALLVWRQTATVTSLEPAACLTSPHLQCALTTRHGRREAGQCLNLSWERGVYSTVMANRHEVLRVLGSEQTTFLLAPRSRPERQALRGRRQYPPCGVITVL